MKKSKLKDYNKESSVYKNIVFFSEGKSYWSTFSPIIKELISKGENLTYVTMDDNDPGLGLESDNIRTFYIGTGFNAMFFMNMIEASVVIMTTPGLGSLNIKRSPGVKHYIHIVHSPTDMHYYRKFSFEQFDSIMCSGSHQIETLRALENIRKSKVKTLLETGCVYMDLLNEKRVKRQEDVKSKCVLLAPTWGKNGALTRYGTSIITPLLESGIEVIIRPHPQQYKSELSLLKKVKKSLKKYSNIEWDERVSGHESLQKSDLMISDLSGVIFDYAFVYQKPVISLDYQMSNNNFEADDLESKAWELVIRKELGALFKTDEDILKLVTELLGKENSKERLKNIRNKYLYNFGAAGKAAAQQLIDILNETGRIS